MIDCIIRDGPKTSTGYGMRWVNGKKGYVHRQVYELANGEIPKGLVIDHLCHNKSCINVAHLEAVTQAENLLRSPTASTLNGQKTHCKSCHPFTGDNLYFDKTKKGLPSRQCRECNRAKQRRNYRMKRMGVVNDNED